MKRLAIALMGILSVFSVQAQRSVNTVTITVNGNKNLHISVDEKDYALYNSKVTGNKTVIDIRDLEKGQHTLEVKRSGENYNRTENIPVIFNLRPRYDMSIKVNMNGSLELTEKLRTPTTDHRPVITNTNFTNLYNNVRNQRSTSGRRTVIANAFNTTGNYFSCSQVVQLLQQVTLESYRLELAKLSYAKITDGDNFNLVFDVLTSQDSRDDLDAYIYNYDTNNYNDDSSNGINDAMPDAAFTNLFETIQQQWPVSTQMNSLTNAFNNPVNYFTSYQASQLIQLVSAENNRLKLAKLSYRSITDRDNFNVVYDLFNSQASKNALKAYVNNYSGGNISHRVPMSDAEYNTLYQDIQFQFLPGAKMTAVTNAFNNTGYYFTCTQAKKLIEMVTLESNRLQLAKLSYRCITDRANFSKLYDVLESQASRDELEAYVQSYFE